MTGKAKGTPVGGRGPASEPVRHGRVTQRDGHVVIVATTARTIDAFLLPHIEQIRQAGKRITVVTGGSVRPEKLPRDVRWMSIPLTRSAARIYAHCRSILEIRKLIIEQSVDVLYVHTPIASAVARVAARLVHETERPAVLYFAHGFHFAEASKRNLTQWMWYWIERLLSRWTTSLIVINKTDFVSVSRWGIAQRGAVHLFDGGVGIDLDYYDRARVPQVPRRAIPENPSLILCVAEFTANKRQALLIEALRYLPADVHLVFAGSGGEQDRVQRQASKVGVADRVTFLGHVPDIRPVIIRADLVVLVSIREGLPRSLMEASALGVPVMSTDTRGAADIVRRMRGEVSSGDHPYEVAEAIRRGLADTRDPSAVRANFENSFADSSAHAVAYRVVSLLTGLGSEARR
jgi:glycosyltransferase involved in cell wall biosynthesis